MDKNLRRDAGASRAPSHKEHYRGYLLEVAGGGSLWWYSVSPRNPDLPIAKNTKNAEYGSCIEALAEAMQHVDRLLRPS